MAAEQSHSNPDPQGWDSPAQKIVTLWWKDTPRLRCIPSSALIQNKIHSDRRGNENHHPPHSCHCLTPSQPLAWEKLRTTGPQSSRVSAWAPFLNTMPCPPNHFQGSCSPVTPVSWARWHIQLPIPPLSPSRHYLPPLASSTVDYPLSWPTPRVRQQRSFSQPHCRDLHCQGWLGGPEMWLVQLEMCCNAKMQTRVWWLSMKNSKMSNISLYGLYIEMRLFWIYWAQ